jgi:hypothetical protein
MAKEYHPDDLAKRIYYISIVGIGAFIASVVIFIL